MFQYLSCDASAQAEKLRAECDKWKRLAAEQEAIAQVLPYLHLITK